MPPDLHEQIIQAAYDLFLQHGYRVSVDAIAAQAKVSKQTLYNRFGSKEALFGAVVNRCSRLLTVPLAGSGEDLRSALLHFARTFRELVVTPQGVALHRMLVCEAARFPEAAQQVFSGGPVVVHAQLAQSLAGAMEAGLLRREDPQFAAGILLSLLGGFDRDSQLYGLPPPADEASRPERIVDLFLRAFAPGATRSPSKD